mmetsp:Transcript_72059/g.169604  ORF Transcript_72059/g.169604 Transcript_72059/m.169604 type:complete len:159 (+) Transcript_72059:441-917(+)
MGQRRLRQNQPLEQPARSAAAQHQNECDQATTCPQSKGQVSCPGFDPVSESSDNATHGHHWMGAPAGIADQQVKACGGDHQQNGIAQAALSQLNIERSPLPTFSIGCSASRARTLFISGLPAAHSATKFLAKVPSWMSERILFISALVSAVIRRGPLT